MPAKASARTLNRSALLRAAQNLQDYLSSTAAIRRFYRYSPTIAGRTTNNLSYAFASLFQTMGFALSSITDSAPSRGSHPKS
jgi:hypothetical protein